MDESNTTSVQNESQDNTNCQKNTNLSKNTSFSRDSLTTEIDGISNEYQQQMLKSSLQIESKYQSIIKEINSKLKSEKIKNKNLAAEIEFNKSIVENTRKLERELQANSLVLKSTKSELDIAECKLEKVCILEKQRENDIFRVRREMEGVEVENERLNGLVSDRTRLCNELEGKLDENDGLIAKTQENLLRTKAASDLKIASMRKEMHAQCIEMQEDVTVLSSRLQEMAVISEELETTKSELKTSRNEVNLLVKTISDLKDKLCYEIAKNENFTAELLELKTEHETEVRNLKFGYVQEIEEIKARNFEQNSVESVKFQNKLEESKFEIESTKKLLFQSQSEFAEIERKLTEKLDLSDQQKWAIETQNERLNQQLKDARLELFEISKNCDKKDKTIHQVNIELAKSENSMKNLNGMYKEKVELTNRIQEDLDARTKDVAFFQKEMEIKERNFEEMTKDGLKNEGLKNAQVLKLNGELEVLKEKHAKEVLGVRNDNEKTEINVCALQIKIKQLTEEQGEFMYSRRNFENQLSAQTSKLEQAEHDLKRSTRKFEFTQDELDQLKLQFDKERAKFETATRDSIQLQDQVSFLLSESDSLKIQLQEAESKTSKSLSKSDRMKEKVKIYQKNLSEAHGEEMEGLYETVKSLTEKLKRKEMELRLNKSGSEKVGRVKVSKNVDFGSVKSVENVKNVEIESEIAEKPEITLKNSVKPEKTLEINLETLPKPKNLEELNKKLKKLEKEKLDLQDELNETLRGKRVSDVSEKRKRVDSVEASDENKENIDPNAKKSKNGKKQRVILGEKTNAQVPVKRSTRDKKKAGAVNKTMY